MKTFQNRLAMFGTKRGLKWRDLWDSKLEHLQFIMLTWVQTLPDLAVGTQALGQWSISFHGESMKGIRL